MVYIVATKLQKAITLYRNNKNKLINNDEIWKLLMLMPKDYSMEAIKNKETRELMDKITFEHGGTEYDKRYPDGIPTSIVITTNKDDKYDSGLIMYPAGHARNKEANLENILNHKFQLLTSLAVKDVPGTLEQLNNLQNKTYDEMDQIYNFKGLIIGENNGDY